jgi:hypothetical protein
MPARNYSSTSEAKTLSSSINDAATTMTLNSITTLPGTYPYTLVIDPDTAKEEIVTVTALSGGTTLTITRNGDNSGAKAHDAAAVVRHMITARDLQEPQDHIYAITNIHGVTGSIAPLASPTFTGTVVLPSTTSIGNVSSTELGYVDGVTSAIQTQLDARALLSPLANAQTGTAYTLVLGDAGKYIEMNNASANAVTVPPTLTPDFPVGTEITIIQTGAGATTITPGAGVTVNYYSLTGAATRIIKSQWSAATLIKRATNTWVLIGNLQ